MRLGAGEYLLDDQTCAGHHHPEQSDEAKRQPTAVVAAIDQYERRGDEVGEEKAHDTTEADATLPERGGHRHVADRADETGEGDDRSDDRVLKDGPTTVAANEDRVPRPGWDEDREEARDEIPDDQLSSEHLQVGNRVAGRIGPRGTRGELLSPGCMAHLGWKIRGDA